MSKIKSAEEILREVHEELSKPNPTDWKSFEKIMKDGTGEAMLKAIKEAQKQAIEATLIWGGEKIWRAATQYKLSKKAPNLSNIIDEIKDSEDLKV